MLFLARTFLRCTPSDLIWRNPEFYDIGFVRPYPDTASRIVMDLIGTGGRVLVDLR